jgi:hypothetical protein
MAGVIAAGLGFLLAPMMSEMPIPGPAEWLGLAAGILVGAMLSVVAGLSAARSTLEFPSSLVP